MPPIFGRDPSQYPSSHLYDNAIDAWLSRGPEYCAMAHNIKHDHRVSWDRESAFDHYVHRPCSAESLQKAIVDYFERNIRIRRLPAYVYRETNGKNLLTGPNVRRPLLSPDSQLIRLLDLNGLGRMFRWASKQKRWKRIFTEFPKVRRIWRGQEAAPEKDTEGRDISDWLNDKLEKSSCSQSQSFIIAALEALNSYGQNTPFQPTWATAWSAFEPFEAAGPERWLQVLGVYRSSSPRWIVLLRYKVREAGTLVRPTQLDAGWDRYHFPSPPTTPLGNGGHSMDLRVAPPSTSLLPEYIHKQITHRPEHLIKWGRTTETTPSLNFHVLKFS